MKLTIKFYLSVILGAIYLSWRGKLLKQCRMAFQYAKPLLLIEVHLMIPSVAGVPMELSLYTAAVAAADLKGKSLKSTAVYLKIDWK